MIESHTHQRPTEYEGPRAIASACWPIRDGDGRLDRWSTFAEGFRHAMNLLVRDDGGVYLVTRGSVVLLARHRRRRRRRQAGGAAAAGNGGRLPAQRAGRHRPDGRWLADHRPRRKPRHAVSPDRRRRQGDRRRPAAWTASSAAPPTARTSSTLPAACGIRSAVRAAAMAESLPSTTTPTPARRAGCCTSCRRRLRLSLPVRPGRHAPAASVERRAARHAADGLRHRRSADGDRRPRREAVGHELGRSPHRALPACRRAAHRTAPSAK